MTGVQTCALPISRQHQAQGCYEDDEAGKTGRREIGIHETGGCKEADDSQNEEAGQARRDLTVHSPRTRGLLLFADVRVEHALPVTQKHAESCFRRLCHNCFQIFLSRISALIHFSGPGVNLEAEV